MKTIFKTLLLLTLVLGLTVMTGCSDDDSPTALGSEPVTMVELTWQASSMRVFQDCDASAGRAEGDFYITFKLSDVTGQDDVVLAERSNVLIKANDNAFLSRDDLDIVLKTEMPLNDGTRLRKLPLQMDIS